MATKREINGSIWGRDEVVEALLNAANIASLCAAEGHAQGEGPGVWRAARQRLEIVARAVGEDRYEDALRGLCGVWKTPVGEEVPVAAMVWLRDEVAAGGGVGVTIDAAIPVAARRVRE